MIHIDDGSRFLTDSGSGGHLELAAGISHLEPIATLVANVRSRVSHKFGNLLDVSNFKQCLSTIQNSLETGKNYINVVENLCNLTKLHVSFLLSGNILTV